MTDLYIGATVVRTRGYYNGMGKGASDIVVDWDDGGVTLREYGAGHSHSALQVTSTQEPWSPVLADVLRQSAEAAIAKYNQYIKGQPKMYKPMDIK